MARYESRTCYRGCNTTPPEGEPADYRRAEGSGGAFSVQVDGEDVTGTVDVPSTGDWVAWETVTVDGVSLSAGEHVLRVSMEDSWWNLNYLDFSHEGERTPGGEETPEGGPDWPENATDPDGDGRYEDLNGNGETDYADVVEYFDSMDSEAMQRNAEYYDYNGNGDVDFADLVELFNET